MCHLDRTRREKDKTREGVKNRFVYYEGIKRELTSHIHWVPRGTRTPKDRDEVNRREVCECDG